MDEVVRRRRNGRLQACDPCRRQKLACDHARPCTRCVKKKKEAACAYTEQAPAAKRLKPASTSNSHSTSASSSAEVPPRLSATSTSSSYDRSSNVTSPATSRASASGPSGSVGYLGYTSFDTVYEETRNSLSLLGAPERPDHSHGLNSTPGSNVQADSISSDRSPRIQILCLRVLRMIPSPKQGMHFPMGPGCHYESWIYRSAQLIRDGIYATWGSHLSTERSIASLEEMALAVNSNTANKEVQDLADPEACMSQFTGLNLRWEAIGILLVYWLRLNGPLRQQLAVANDCIDICSELAAPANFFLLHLHHRRCVLQSLVTGDASFDVCRWHAQANGVVTFGGLHVETSQHTRPTLSSEMKRRSLWMFYTLDKVLVAFSGRPPGLTRHYITTSIPLDLDDDDLFADEATLSHAIATKLDIKGWNTTNSVHATTMIRARGLAANLLDETFEIALGSQAATVPLDKLLDIR